MHAGLEEQKSAKRCHNHDANDESTININALKSANAGGFALGSPMLFLRPDICKEIGAAAHHLRHQHDAHHEAKAQARAARMEVFVPNTRGDAARALSLGQFIII